MTPPLPRPVKKPERKSGKRGRGTPFPKGVSGNPGGRPKKPPPDIKAILLEGNKAALHRVWKLMHSTDERISLAAALGWLKKTVPDAERLEVGPIGSSAVSAADVRTALEARLLKLLAPEDEPDAPNEIDVTPAPPAGLRELEAGEAKAG